jgi:UDPglucose--hexose-1-phosphate uridylyltransferase
MNFDYPHRRFNPLTREWVLASPHRAKRPWLGQIEKIPQANIPSYDPKCLLCPGNTRINGEVNAAYKGTFVFDNDFPAVLTPDKMGADDPANPMASLPSKLFVAQPVTGICRVVCFSPRHDLSLPELSLVEAEAVVQTWRDQTADIGAHDYINYVQVFENKGEVMGCSNPHPHSQIWSTSEIPVEPAKEIAAMTDYLKQHGSCLLCDYVEAERKAGERVVCENQHFTAVAPFWAVWPFEIMVVARRHVGSLTDLTEAEITSLADLLRRVTARYDNLFEVSFPYSMGFHQSPTDGLAHEECHLHLHFYPPLLRSAAVRKFMVGFEMLAMPQRDLTPETAAARLRSLSEVHYRRHIAM